MRYSEEFVKKVLDKTDIVKLIGQYTQLHENNGIYNGKCVFHNDNGNTMVVYPDKKVFHCFGCGKGGNAAVFLMEMKGISMNKAVEQLAKLSGIQITQNDIAKKNNDLLKANLYAIYKDTAIFYRKKLSDEEGKKALEYLEARFVTDETIKRFGLGYAPAKGNSLYKYLKAKGYSDDLMIQAGLIKLSETGPYDMFRGRVMFPIMDENRRVIAFGGRVIDNEIKPKYLNSPETPIFNKSNTLYGIHDIKGANNDYFILCEGNMDVVKLHQAGFRNSVATLGTAFTSMHVPVLKKHTDSLVLSFDGDAAGQKAAMRTIKTVEDAGLNLKVLSMNPCKDPDEFINTFGVKEYQDRIDRSIDQVDFQLKYLATQYDLDDPAQKKEYLGKAVEAIMKQQDREQTIEIER